MLILSLSSARFWAFTLLPSYPSLKSPTKPFCFPDVKEGNLQNSHCFTLRKLESANPLQSMQRCGNSQRATLPTKIQSSECTQLTWTLELGAKNNKQKHPSSEIIGVNWLKWKQVIKKGLLKDILRKKLDLTEFYKLLAVNTVHAKHEKKVQVIIVHR